MQWHHKLAQGHLRHVRHRPTTHQFDYRMGMVWLDLDELSALNRLPFWSSKRWSLIRFQRQDYLDPGIANPKSAVFERLRANSIAPKQGRVCLLTQLRHWGFCFNPVSFYFCFDDQESLYAIIAEITNTPWGEKHCYVLETECNAESQPESRSHQYPFEFAKTFHVSPFMPMNLRYRWSFKLSEQQIAIKMTLLEPTNKPLFYAALDLALSPLTSTNAKAAVFSMPFNSLRTVSAIYWQALQLWLKRIPFYNHPVHGDS